MNILLISSTVGFAAAVVLVPLVGRLARRADLLDYPDHRKHHGLPTPLVGGPVIAAAFVASLLMVRRPGGAAGWTLLGAMLFLALVGTVDDKRHLSARWKFLAQGLACLAVIVFAGLSISSLGRLGWRGDVSLGSMAAPFTVFAVVGVINAVNMVDGVDGLAGGLCLIALLLFMGANHFEAAANPGVWTLAWTAGGALAGFLLYNAPSPFRRRAKVFLGDSGTLVLGFLLGCLAVSSTQHQPDSAALPLPPMLAVWFMALPIMDTVAVMVRRVLTGRNPFSPDRGHMHHLCLRRGWSVARTTYTLCALQAVIGLGAWLAWRHGLAEHWLMVSYVSVFALYFVWTLRKSAATPDERRRWTASGFSGLMTAPREQQAFRDKAVRSAGRDD